MVFILIACVFTLPTYSQIQTSDSMYASYDYKSILPHPRLFLASGEEEQIIHACRESTELKRIHDYIINTSDRFLQEPVVEFEIIGPRLLDVSREALMRLYYLSYSYRTTKQEAYLDRAKMEIRAVCAFESWNPSHFLDVAEMCLAVAIAYDWLYDALDEETKHIAQEAILAKAIAPATTPKAPWFYKASNNWNPVCNAGLVAGALAIYEEDPEKCQWIIEKALQTVPKAMEVYAPHGNYPEGPAYWNYGTTFLMLLSASLESALGNDQALSQAKGFMESAEYMAFACSPSGKFYNYYDCREPHMPSPSLFWFASKLNRPELVFQEWELIKKGGYKPVSSHYPERLLPNALVFGKNLDLSNIRPPKKNSFIGEGKTPIALVRSSWDTSKKQHFLGIKGGTASDSHGHMDQGSFVYDIDDVRWVMDFPLQDYHSIEKEGISLWDNQQEGERWTIFRMNNFNHSTLSINKQLHNVEGKAWVTKKYTRGKKLGMGLNLRETLNLNQELKQAQRTVVLVKGNYVQVEDILESGSDSVHLYWNLVSPSEAQIINDHTIELKQKGKVMQVIFSSKHPFKLELRPAENPSQVISPITQESYPAFNEANPGVVMLGFTTILTPHSQAVFKVELREME